MNKLLESLRHQFEHSINTKPITGSKIQVWLPVYYEDGDMVDIYVESLDNGMYRITDSGMTLMKLTYSYDINTDNKKKILNQMVEASGLSIEQGILLKDVPNELLYKELIGFSNAIIRISTMSYFKREMIKNMFYEMIEECISQQVSPDFAVERQYLPLEGKEEYSVDYRIIGHKDIFLYAVKDTSKARLVTICEQTFRLNGIASDSIVVYEDFGAIQNKDQKRILNATGKQFTSLEEFQSNGLDYLKRRISA